MRDMALALTLGLLALTSATSAQTGSPAIKVGI